MTTPDHGRSKVTTKRSLDPYWQGYAAALDDAEAAARVGTYIPTWAARVREKFALPAWKGSSR